MTVIEMSNYAPNDGAMRLTAKKSAKGPQIVDSTVIFDDSRISLGSSTGDTIVLAVNLRETTEYESLEERVRKLETEGPAAINWADVVDLATIVLKTQGKDLVAGCWLTYALFQTERYQGFAAGLGILREMIGHHWSTMEPPVVREKARVGAIEWLAGRAAPLCEAPPAKDDHAAILYAFEALGVIEQQINERLTRESCSLREVVRALAPRRDEVRQAMADAKRERDEAAKAVVAVAAPAAAPAAPAAPPLDRGAVDTLPETLRTLAAGMLGADPTDPRAYVLSRVASWWRIRQLPPNDNGRTSAMPPVDETGSLRDLCRNGQDTAALLLLNDLVWSAPFWFDGHRIASEILRRLGSEFADAHAALCATMPLLFRRLPALGSFVFADGTPLVGSETRSWLAECGSSSTQADDGLDRCLAEVRSLLAAGKGKEAVDRMATLTQGTGSGRDRLLRQIAQAQFCLDVGLVAAALPLLDHLDHLVEAHHLENWEPVLAAQVAELRFRALTHADAFKLVTEDRRRQGLDLTRQRLVRLDFATAARLFR